jgi:hypothetical protein
VKIIRPGRKSRKRKIKTETYFKWQQKKEARRERKGYNNKDLDRKTTSQVKQRSKWTCRLGKA